MRTLSRNILLPLSLFLLTVPMQLGVGGAHLNTSLAVMLVLSAWYFIDQVAVRRPLGREHVLFGILGLLLTYFLGLSVLREARDFLVVQMCVYGIIMYASSLVLVRAYRRTWGDRGIEVVLKSLFLLGLAHAVIQFLVLLIPPVADVVYSVVTLSEDSAAHISQGYRSPGLFSSGAAILGTFNAWVLLIGQVAYLRSPGRPSWRRLLLMSVATIFEIAAIAISGRTGFVTLLIGLGVIFVYEAFGDRGMRLGRNLLLTLLGSAALVTVAALMISTDNIEQNLRWSFEFIYSLSEGRGLATSSTSVLFEQMFFVPDDWFPLLFGSGNFGRSPDFPYIDSDAGYILMIFGGGVVGMLLMMSVFVYILAVALRSRHKELAMLLIVFVVTTFVVNVKDFYFIQNSGVSQLLIICFALLAASGDAPMLVRSGTGGAFPSVNNRPRPSRDPARVSS